MHFWCVLCPVFKAHWHLTQLHNFVMPSLKSFNGSMIQIEQKPFQHSPSFLKKKFLLCWSPFLSSPFSISKDVSIPLVWSIRTISYSCIIQCYGSSCLRTAKESDKGQLWVYNRYNISILKYKLNLLQMEQT